MKYVKCGLASLTVVVAILACLKVFDYVIKLVFNFNSENSMFMSFVATTVLVILFIALVDSEDGEESGLDFYEEEDE